jgi:hypothetical protein
MKFADSSSSSAAAARALSMKAFVRHGNAIIAITNILIR